MQQMLRPPHDPFSEAPWPRHSVVKNVVVVVMWPLCHLLPDIVVHTHDHIRDNGMAVAYDMNEVKVFLHGL